MKIPADERLAEARGVKMLIVGPAGISQNKSVTHAQGHHNTIR
jgi:2-keto-3-deoxy-L-rhamnonate aldolase RhmA